MTLRKRLVRLSVDDIGELGKKTVQSECKIFDDSQSDYFERKGPALCYGRSVFDNKL